LSRLSVRTSAGHSRNSQWWLVLLLAACKTQAAESYRLNATNSRVAFTVQHLGFEWISARFNDISGEFVLDRLGPMSRVDVTVAIASLDSSDPLWNERLQSAEWLDAQHYPHMTYHSTRIELDDQRAVANGDLTLHGVTRPVVMTVTLINCSTDGQCRFVAHGRIKRSEFGLPHGLRTGGDQVDISISCAINEPVGNASAHH
jgi:polyisoprenoid-binding protein YceI